MKRYQINNPNLKLDVLIDSNNEAIEAEIIAYLHTLEGSLDSNQIISFVEGRRELTKKLLANIQKKSVP